MNTQYSSRVARYAAAVVDGIIIGIINIVLSLFTLPLGGVALTSLALSQSTSNLATGTPFLLINMILVIIRLLIGPVYFWLTTYKYGKSLGKKIFGLEIVDESTGARLTIGKAFIREIPGKFISGIFLNLGNFWILWDKKRQGWHDKFAGDVVIAKEPLAGGKKVIASILFIAGLILPIIAIIGAVLAVGLVSLSPNRQLQKASDTNVKASVQQIGYAALVYHNGHGYYPSEVADLFLDKDISVIPTPPQGYSPYLIIGYPEGCTTQLKNCTKIAVQGDLRQPVVTGNNFWCFRSDTQTSEEAAVCKP
jgi:uncharacterized RDD family membrane protein YckC